MSREARVYTPDSALRDPRRLVADMRQDARAALHIGLRLARRDLDAQYRQTVLGYLWAVLPIALIAGVWILLNRATVLQVDTGPTPYWLYVLTGSVLWQAFVDALNGPVTQFQNNRVLMARVSFPKEALLVSAATQTLVSLALRMIVIVAACLAAGVALKPAFGLVVIPVFGLLLFGTVVGTLLVPAGALFGDVQKLVLAMTTPLMLVAPIAYPLEAAQGVVRTLMELNPLTPLIVLARALMLGAASHSWYAVLMVLLASAAGLLASWVFYRLAVPVIIEKLEA